ncbi:hypothetical protein PENTCL1PPCAC_16219 [Pristionchus entomophagus]|uniref:Acyl-coenzyme A oxidase n=1 Tax=Pristionchus entomophagus TaxID=358040 RepID=A0AAV5TII7_9BILA|nr:hypothetical protein PENTCL1PPCAC_16219 [Pristionchus entomophagus]
MSAFNASPGASLDEWRSKASFDGGKMRAILQGGEDKLRLKDEYWQIMEKDPLFKKPNRHLSMEESRLLTHQRWKKVLEYGLPCDMYANYEGFSAFSDVLEEYDKGLQARIQLHSGVFVGALSSMGTERHKELIEKANRNQIIGCFCLTELSHGSNTQAIQTTATYEKGQLVFRSPHIGAMKVWSGNLAQSATHALVFAQLYVGGKCEGVHGFVVQVRDEKTHRVLPGLRIGDMGEKPGHFNCIENGWMLFEDYRCSTDALLNKGCDITADGRYVHAFKSDRDKRSVSLGALSMGRIGIVGMGVNACRAAATIGIRYSAVRKQFGPPDGDELPILTYPLQRRRLLPILAASICMGLFQDKMIDLFSQYMARLLSGEKSDELVELSKEVHGLSSCTKPRATWLGVAALAEARAACGGHGFLYISRLNELRDTYDPSQTFEGENNILAQQASNYLLSQKKQGIVSSPMGTTDFLQTRPISFKGWNADSLENVIAAYEWLLHYTLTKTEKALEDRKRRGDDAFTARNETQIDTAHPLALAYAELTMIKWAEEAVKEIEDVKCRSVLHQVVRLFAVSQLQPHLTLLYIGGYCTGPEFGTRVKEEQLALERSLSPECVALVDAIASPDFAVASALGTSDGRAYENMVADFFSREVDRAPFADDLLRVIEANKTKPKL